ncbi:TadE/TadG family type IV pilus assembly protein [Roseibium sediminicola]|uniref:Pilus assembly protein n=1 Tax=Roseibium sediminicola TaxID=2933272 RepID=A0ABT0GXW0_9HYPH|nr:TadE/TadG family type IV pilus assembly protein [Roseibium sp. CAU 1639]MCK7614070.1 pilus assembly protein [Roseibium sp. CAU 1639]
MRLIKAFVARTLKARRSFRRDQRGTTAIEFSFVAIPFFLVVFGIIEVGLSHFVNRMVDNAVISASRMIRTGQASNASYDEEDFKSDICGFLPDFLCSMDRIVVDVEKIDSFDLAKSPSESLYDDDGELKEDSNYEESGSGDIVVVNVIYRWPMITALLALDMADNGSERYLTSTVVFRNEPWN